MSYFAKPKGLWLTDDSDNNWWDWCMSETFHLEGLAHKTHIELDMSNILELRSAKDIDDFTLDYGTQDYEMAHFMVAKYPGYVAEYAINWAMVARDFRGLAITPYIRERRTDRHTSWYYTWDCSSACIWDYDAILDITPIPQIYLPRPTPLLLEPPAAAILTP